MDQTSSLAGRFVCRRECRTAEAAATPSAAPRAAAPKAPAKASTPAHPSASKPSTGTHPSTSSTRPGTARPGTARPGATTGRNGTGTVHNNGTHTVGRTGPAAGRPAGNMARGGNGALPGTGTGSCSRRRQVSLRGGGTANFRPNGQIRSINRNGMHIEHGLNGNRRIESTHNGARVVTTGRSSGYVQRAYVTLHPWRTQLCFTNHHHQSPGIHQRLPFLSLSRPLLLWLPSRVLLPSCILRVGLQPLAGAGLLRMGLGWCALVRILRRVLCALSCLSLGCVLADGLFDFRKFTSGVPGAGGSECRCCKRRRRKRCSGRATATQWGKRCPGR